MNLHQLLETILNALTDQQLTGLLRWLLGGLGLVAIWIIKREFTQILAAVDRIPTKEWFDEMKDTMKQVTPMVRLTEDLAGRVDGLEKSVQEINLRMAAHGMGRRHNDP